MQPSSQEPAPRPSQAAILTASLVSPVDGVQPPSLISAGSAPFSAVRKSLWMSDQAAHSREGRLMRTSTTPSSEPLPATTEGPKKWNTANLGWRVGRDLVAAGAAGVLVAPLITSIDRAIMENASNRATLSTSLRTSLLTLALRPHNFLTSRPFLLIFALYTGTYFSANTLDTLTSTLAGTPASSTTSGPAKFLATSTANLSLCLYKDSHFTRLFGPTTTPTLPPRAVPLQTYALFATRDMLTIFASFNLPPLLAPLLPLTPTFESHLSRTSAAQFLAPAACQLLSTPLHLLGLDLYNRAGPGVSRRSRLARVARDWAKSCAARVCRIVPAFGVGGVVNMRVRAGLMRGLE